MRGVNRPSAQVAVGLAFWLLFGCLWLDLLLDGKASVASLSASALQLVAVGVLVLLVTLGWVRHNVGIHARKGARGGGPVRQPGIEADRLGRPLAWELPGGHADALVASRLVVTIDDGVKSYWRGDDAPQPGSRA